MNKNTTDLGTIYDLIEAIKYSEFSQYSENVCEWGRTVITATVVVEITRSWLAGSVLPYSFFVKALIKIKEVEIKMTFNFDGRSFVNAIPTVKTTLIKKVRNLTIEIPTLKK